MRKLLTTYQSRIPLNFQVRALDFRERAHVRNGNGFCPANPRAPTSYLKLSGGMLMIIHYFTIRALDISLYFHNFASILLVYFTVSPS